jgi:tyrosinase
VVISTPLLGKCLTAITPSLDAVSSANNSDSDPYFFLHHAQIDRVWWIWQNLDLVNRLYAIDGTLTLLNTPPSRNGTLDDTIWLGVNGEPITIRSAVSTLAGKFCYVYK